jgi:hypothetical protein
MQLSIKTTWVSYNGRPIDMYVRPCACTTSGFVLTTHTYWHGACSDHGQEGEPVTIMGEPYLYVASRDVCVACVAP